MVPPSRPSSRAADASEKADPIAVNPPKRHRWLRGLVFVGILTVGAAGVGALWLRHYLDEKLSPQVATLLSEQIHRPVELGRLQWYSFTGLRFGPSVVPATPQDPDWAKVQGVDVAFDFWAALRTRHLALDLTLVSPQAYVEQGKDGKWLDITLEPQKPGWFEVETHRISLENGQVTIVPRNPGGELQAPIALQNAQGKIDLRDKAQHIALDLNVQVPEDGTKTRGNLQINAQGAVNLSQMDFALRTEKLALPTVFRLAHSQVTALPIPAGLTVSEGQMGGTVQGTLQQGTLSNLSGELQVAQGSVNLPQISVPLTGLGGTIQMNHDRYTFRKVTAQWGIAEAMVEGILTADRQHWEQSTFTGKVKIPPVMLPEALKPFGLEHNLPAAGKWGSNLNLSGTLANLQWDGQVANVGNVLVDTPVKDQLEMTTLKSRVQTTLRRVCSSVSLINLDQPNTTSNLSSVDSAQASTQNTNTGSIIRPDQGSSNPPISTANNQQCDYQLDPLQLSEIRGVPLDGGLLAGTGTIVVNLDRPGESPLDLNLSVENLPADAVGKRLDIPPPIHLGIATAQSHVTGTLVEPQLLTDLQVLDAEYPIRARLNANRHRWIVEQALVTLAGGVLNVQGEQKPNADHWNLQVRSATVAMEPMKIPLRGAIAGVVNLVGPRNYFNLDRMSAQGAVRFSQGISIINDPLDAEFTWSGKTLQVQHTAAPGFSGQGTIAVDLSHPRDPKINALDLQVRLTDYDFKKLPVKFPEPVNVAAAVNFQGRVTGAPATPWVQGDVQVNQLTVNQKPFEPYLAGGFRLNPDGAALRIRGQRDLVETRIDKDNLPHTATIVWNGGVGELRRQGDDRFQVNLTRFPVVALGLELPTPQVGEQPLMGTASGEATGSLKPTFALAGNVAIDQPALGYMQGQHLTTAFRLADGNLALQNGSLNIGSSRFQFDGRAILNTTDPRYQLNLAVDQGQVGDFLQVFRWFDLIDLKRGLKPPEYNHAADLLLPSVGLPDQPLQLQLYRFAEVKNQVIEAVRRQQSAEKLPPLNQLVGNFGGRIAVAGTLKTGITANFQFKGDQWHWGDRYHASHVEVAGDFKNQRLTLQPVHLTLNDTTELSFQGILGQSPQYGTLSIKALPLSLARDFIDLPLDLEGAVDLEANLAGSVNDPQLVGEMNLRDASLNGAALKTEKTGFNYSDRRLSFGGTLLVATSGNDPVEISGEFPAFQNFQLPPLALQSGATVLTGQDFSALRKGDALESPNGSSAIVTSIAENGKSVTLDQPLSCSAPCRLTVVPRLQLNLDVANEGIKVLNLLTRDKLTWKGGEGSVKLALGGTIANPRAFGSADFKNATIAAEFIPSGESITGLTGQINFENDRILVDHLSGRFSEGEINAHGAIGLAAPLNFSEPSDPNATQPNAPRDAKSLDPLTLHFQDLVLNIPGRYRGGAAGDVQILGSVLAPRLGGSITVNNGKVILPDPSSVVASKVFGTDTTDTSSAAQRIGFSPLTFDRLNLSLGNNITIAADPLFSFKATGDLSLRGGLENLQPEGTIKLTRGQVNLFTTNFLLAQGAKNEAVFRPITGLDPNLNIEMVASVTEISRRRPTAGPVIPSEISDSNNTGFNELQTVRIHASVNGAASDILKNLRLSSRPNRTPSELYALMGGGFVNTLGQGGNSTLALANLAGSALLNNLQAALNSVLRGPIDFRLFPLVVDSQNRKDNSQQSSSNSAGAETLALGAEVGVNLTNSVSFSMLRLLTIDIPTRFNLNYQINNNLQLRGTTDFNKENRVVLEYETRF